MRIINAIAQWMLRRRRLLCETFLAARNEERQLHSQATNIEGVNEYFLLIRATFFGGRGWEGGGGVVTYFFFSSSLFLFTLINKGWEFWKIFLRN